jgi:hypothetical protein
MPPEWSQAKPTALLATHNLPRYAALRRTVALVNPTAQFGLCHVLEKGWADIEGAIRASTFSASSPTTQAVGRAIDRKVPRVDLPTHRALNRVGARWLLRADIARCYPSIYTHCIPWALHTRARAKSDRSSDLLGNRIDEWVRKGQSGQTMGIPIGPDSSLLIAELILCAADRRLSKDSTIRVLRYMDDYEFATSSHGEAVDMLGALQDALSEYELALNGEKTKIVPLPQEFQRPWANALRRLEIRAGAKHEESDLIGYFDAAFDSVRKFPNEPVLNFALARLRSLARSARSKNRRLLEALLLQAMVLEAGTHRYVIEHFTKPENRPTSSLENLREVLTDQVLFHAKMRHTSEVAWALWASIALNVPMESRVAQVVAGLEDDVVALLALHGHQIGLLPGLDKGPWTKHMTASELRGEHWLLAYEGLMKGWLPSFDGSDYLSSDPCFGWMKDARVSFYDPNTAAQVPDEMLEPASAWEDSYST